MSHVMIPENMVTQAKWYALRADGETPCVMEGLPKINIHFSFSLHHRKYDQDSHTHLIAHLALQRARGEDPPPEDSLQGMQPVRCLTIHAFQHCGAQNQIQ